MAARFRNEAELITKKNLEIEDNLTLFRKLLKFDSRKADENNQMLVTFTGELGSWNIPEFFQCDQKYSE